MSRCCGIRGLRDRQEAPSRCRWNILCLVARDPGLVLQASCARHSLGSSNVRMTDLETFWTWHARAPMRSVPRQVAETPRAPWHRVPGVWSLEPWHLALTNREASPKNRESPESWQGALRRTKCSHGSLRSRQTGYPATFSRAEPAACAAWLPAADLSPALPQLCSPLTANSIKGRKCQRCCKARLRR